ncbi:hypothetical protein M900_1574 [Bacteriovorax sp. Seq25_V]|nr:hypothetical protein M900_1574 [Bacteriovorax sp. Seq25_V]
MTNKRNSKKIHALFLGLVLVINSNSLAYQCADKKKELKEIDARQKELLDKKNPGSTKNLDELLTDIDKLNAERVGLLALMRIKDDYNDSRAALEKLNAQEFLSNNAIAFLNDLSNHIKSVAHHNLIINTMNTLSPEQIVNTNASDDKSILLQQTEKMNKDAWRITQTVKKSLGLSEGSLFDYMKDCAKDKAKKSIHCDQFQKNLTKLRDIGNRYGDPTFLESSKKVIDNYGKLLTISMNTEGKSQSDNEDQFYKAIQEHKSTLRDVDLLGGADIFGLNRHQNDINEVELAKIDRLLEYFENVHSNSEGRDTASNKIEYQLDSTLNKNRKSLRDSVDLIRTSLINIKSKCDILKTTSCGDDTDSSNLNLNRKTLTDELISLNKAFAPYNTMVNKDGSPYKGENSLPQLDGKTIFNPEVADTRKKYIDLLESAFTKSKIDNASFDNVISTTSDPNLKHCGKMKAVFLGIDKLNNFIKHDEDVDTIRKCQLGISSLNLGAKETELQRQISAKSAQVQRIIQDTDFKNLEILKSILYTDYYKKCTNEDDIENMAIKGTCSEGFINSHTTQIDILKDDYNEINDEIITRNYLRYLDINDRGSLFKDPSQWNAILKGQCAGYGEARRQLSSSSEQCGFKSSCSACEAVYNLGKSAIAAKMSEELSNLPMHVYREYDPKTGTMLNKRHPIKSMVAHTMMYAARRIPQIGAPFIQWQQFRGQALQMQYSALHSKQMYTWNKQYRAQAYKAYDLTNPNLFNPYSRSFTPGYSF